MSILLVGCLLFSSIGVNASVGLGWSAGVPVAIGSGNVHGHFLRWGFAEVGVDLWISPPFVHGSDIAHLEMELAGMISYSATVGTNIQMDIIALKFGAGIDHHRFWATTWKQQPDYSDSDWGFHILGSVGLRVFWKVSLIMKYKYTLVDIDNDDPNLDTHSVTFGIAVN
ncbi:MAG: hypothetical protein AMJ70_08180 [Dehalococcoidia bacterium SG8_51_3]|uniref:Uncharacterized protein n=1 Tax=candidate division WOR_3 bacterium SM23_42 TaxID=1703779 RepID=A0A0S8FV61_UNCW3|nr:MAG: hypothetical protein AMJ70_08180 [Dehalococcoidia bacterium SG8_51_3]KPK64446.1 MAG: hypothetical protein AMJ83_01660 [candidate division WOR_3 bacterium SM23_42]